MKNMKKITVIIFALLIISFISISAAEKIVTTINADVTSTADPTTPSVTPTTPSAYPKIIIQTEKPIVEEIKYNGKIVLSKSK